MKILLLAISTFLLSITASYAQSSVGLKTNLLYAGYTQTPNLGVEIGLGQRTTIDIGAGYNPWNYIGDKSNSRKLKHVLAEMEFRLWTCERFSGLFFGVHLLGVQYNLGGYNLSGLIELNSKDYRYEGWAAGGGLSVGYQFVLAKRWNLELNVGGGYAGMRYDKSYNQKCGKLIQDNLWHNYWGVTRAGVSIIYFL